MHYWKLIHAHAYLPTVVHSHTNDDDGEEQQENKQLYINVDNNCA